MEGVTILNTIPAGDISVLAIIVGSLFVLAGIVGFAIYNGEEWSLTLGFTGVLVGAGLILGGIFINPTPERYEVLIDDSVSMIEFNEHYNIIEQRGDIWVVELKGDSE